MLYPAELLARTIALYKKTGHVSTEKLLGSKLRVLFYAQWHILLRTQKKKGGVSVRETNDPYADLEDLIFDEDAGRPSER